MPEEKKHKREAIPKTYPETGNWQNPAEDLTNIQFDHPIFRHALKISLLIGIMVAIAIFFFRDEAPWWMPVFAGTIVTAIVFRLLRPRLRHPSIEDEI